VPGETLGGQTYGAGAVVVLAGGPDGLAPTPRLWSQDSPGVPDRAESQQSEVAYEGDQFGAALAAGDFDGDHRDDLAVGVPGELVKRDLCPEHCHDGAITVLQGSSTGLSGKRSRFWTARGLFHRPAAWALAEFGGTLASADLNGDRLADLAAGAPAKGGDVDAARIREGSVAVLYGTRGRGLTRSSARAFDAHSPGLARSNGPWEAFGTALTAAQFGRGRFADLAVGVTDRWSGRGRVHVIYGGRRGLTTAGSAAWSQSTRGVPGVSQNEEEFGVLGTP
jgi:hypothetical protein